ncbi:hypothetical protein FDH82_gp31 [Roseobacter phage RDJL Phi 2]|uniref:Uncharacterized protein n=1 Tax=Roseobacter phage RDJL Phi 2 TaxID=1682380 RepID=A0A0K0PVG6_9CAUD|nr:hypothetical protein FDH82_gp31 [Roseobacter phage RDJL Phi 2]AKQ75821.1 hypothetical protein RDJLphi2_gp31 [Roseobacter phage RDJL Phi 2]
MKRPKLLVDAAQRLVAMHNGKMETRSLAVIRDEEMEFNDCRLTGTGNYTCRRHIELLAEYMVAKRKAETKCT